METQIDTYNGKAVININLYIFVFCNCNSTNKLRLRYNKLLYQKYIIIKSFSFINLVIKNINVHNLHKLIKSDCAMFLSIFVNHSKLLFCNI